MNMMKIDVNAMDAVLGCALSYEKEQTTFTTRFYSIKRIFRNFGDFFYFADKLFYFLKLDSQNANFNKLWPRVT